MLYNSQNKTELEDLYIHDSFFSGYQFDYNTKTLTFTCQNDFLKKNFVFAFHHVIYTEMQCCDFWTAGQTILWLNLREDSSKLRELRKRKAIEEAERVPSSEVIREYQEIRKKHPTLMELENRGRNSIGLEDFVDYFEVEFQLNSGDVLFVICESLSVDESDLL